MKRLTSIIAMAALVIAGGTALLLTSVARADVIVLDGRDGLGGGSVTGSSFVTIAGRQPSSCYVPIGGPPAVQTLTNVNPNLFANHRVGPAGRSGVAQGATTSARGAWWKLVYTTRERHSRWWSRHLGSAGLGDRVRRPVSAGRRDQLGDLRQL